MHCSISYVTNVNIGLMLKYTEICMYIYIFFLYIIDFRLINIYRKRTSNRFKLNSLI